MYVLPSYPQTGMVVLGHSHGKELLDMAPQTLHRRDPWRWSGQSGRDGVPAADLRERCEELPCVELPHLARRTLPAMGG